MRVLVGITGASGAVYGTRTTALLAASGAEVQLLVSPTAWGIVEAELPGPPLPERFEEREGWLAVRGGWVGGAVRLRRFDDFTIPFASGSNPPDAVIVAPCSMGTAGRIAAGVSSSVLERCADVALKERTRLVLVPRETPLSQIHLENLLRLSRAGAEIVPASPGFYHRPATVRDLVDFVVSRILARAGLRVELHAPWGEENPPREAPSGAAAHASPGKARGSGRKR